MKSHAGPRRDPALAASEARFRDLVELLGDWYWEQDAELRFVAASGAGEDRGGINAAEHVGRRRWELPRTEIVGGDWGPHKADLAARRAFRDLLLRRTATDGRVRYVRVSGMPLYGQSGQFSGYHGIAVDVTKQLTLEDELRMAATRMRELVENLDEPMCLTDPAERIVFANQRFREMNEPVAYAIAPGKPYAEHLRAAAAMGLILGLSGDIETWVEERMAVRRRGGGPYERRRTNDMLLLLYDQRFDDGSVLTYGIDVTALKRAEIALRELNQSLEQRVRERTAELEAFAYSVSHDLRAPLRAIGSFSRMVVESEGSNLSVEGRRKLGLVERNAVRMGQLMDGLLMLARVSRAQLAPAPIDMQRIARLVAAELGHQYPLSALSIGALPAASGDATLVRLVLTNLLDNALKYSAKAAAPRVEVGWSETEGAYYVRDNGVGFDMSDATRLFQAFERLHSGAEFEGTGIGLAIVKRVIDRHGGTVRAEAAPGAGATLWFTLPAPEVRG